MHINLEANLGVSARWSIEVCTPTPTGDIVDYPYGKEMHNNAILNSFLSGIILHARGNSWPSQIVPAFFTDGFMQLGTGLKPISYNDTKLDKFYQESSLIRPYQGRVNTVYSSESGIALFEKIYDFPTSPASIKYTEAGFRQLRASEIWSSFPLQFRNPIYSRFLFTKESPVIGYISGKIDTDGSFLAFGPHPLDANSGVFTGSSFPGFMTQIKEPTVKLEFITGFISGFRQYLGAFTPFPINNDGSNTSTGYFLNGEKYLFPPSNIISGIPVTGYISGNMTELSGFIPFLSEGENPAEIPSSGYFLDNNQYKFTEPFNEFSGLSGFENGYSYYGFDFPYGSGFVSDIENELFGLGKVTGIIGSRNTYVLSGVFSGFDNISGFDSRAGYMYSGFFIPSFGSGFTGINYPSHGTGYYTGIIGYRNLVIDPAYSGLSGIPTHEYGWYFTNSGMFGSGMEISGRNYRAIYPDITGFSGLKYSASNLIVGFISGYMDENGIFTNLSPGLSGYIFNGNRFYFPYGSSYSGINSGDLNFEESEVFYTGFPFLFGSGFSGDDSAQPLSGSGILTGFVGSYIKSYFGESGILTGFVGYKKYIDPISLSTGQFVKLKYQIAFRIPQIINETYVTGDNVIYGDFNASGRIKLLGPLQSIFGVLRDNRLTLDNGTSDPSSALSNQGFWWHARQAFRKPSNIATSTYVLGASMAEASESYTAFPAVNTRPNIRLIRDVRASNAGPDDPNGIESVDENTARYFMFEAVIKYPSTIDNTIYAFPGDEPFSMKNLFIFPAEYPNRNEDIGGIWFTWSETDIPSFSSTSSNIRYYKPESGQCGWFYKFDSHQRKWEDQAIYITTVLKVSRDKFFEDPYYGRYPQ